jgi:hypothetical protein
MGCAGSTESKDEENGAAACQRFFDVSGKDQHDIDERDS